VGIRINQNIMAMNSYRNLTTSESQLSKSLEKLSSGFRINKAADDASGLVISEGLRSQVKGLNMAIRNTQDGVSVVQTAEGALTEVHSLLQRIRELAVQASSTGSSDQASRNAAQEEVSQLLEEIDRIGDTTRFGGQFLLNGDYGVQQATIQGGQSTDNRQDFEIIAGTDQFDINVGGGLRTVTLSAVAAGDYDTPTGAADLQANIENAIKGALALAGDDPDSIEVSVTGGESSADPFEVTIEGQNGVTITLVDTDAQLAYLGITDLTEAATGSGGTFQVGADEGEVIDVSIGDIRTAALGPVGGIATLDVSTVLGISTALDDLDAAITEVSELRGTLGAIQNRFEHTIANLSVTVENLSASESRIRDTDMASEMMAFTRAQILQQAGTAMLAQANAVPQSVLQLLQ
jgi:flagellin